MKYLKKYNENLTEVELVDSIKSHLSFLLDVENFTIDKRVYDDGHYIRIDIINESLYYLSKPYSNYKGDSRWYKLKNDILSYYDYLKNKVSELRIHISVRETDYSVMSYNNAYFDKINDNDIVEKIELSIFL